MNRTKTSARVMNLIRTIHFERNYAKAPQQVQRAFDKQSSLLLQNLTTLAARQEVRRETASAARVNKDWRFYFLIQHDGSDREHHPHPK